MEKNEKIRELIGFYEKKTKISHKEINFLDLGDELQIKYNQIVRKFPEVMNITREFILPERKMYTYWQEKWLSDSKERMETYRKSIESDYVLEKIGIRGNNNPYLSYAYLEKTKWDRLIENLKKYYL